MTVQTASDLQTTRELFHAAMAGDQRAWGLLVERFEPLVASTIVGYRLQPADAVDAAQSTWLRMVEHRDVIREPAALGAWLRTTARRECLKILADRRRVEPLGDDEAAAFCDPAPAVEQRVVDADTAQRVRRLVDVLPARSAFLLHELFRDDPPGYAELSRGTGIPVGSIGPTRARALGKLRRMLDGRSLVGA